MTFLTMTEKTNSSLAARQSRLLKQGMFALVVLRGGGAAAGGSVGSGMLLKGQADVPCALENGL